MDETQQELPLPFPELSGDMPLLPARMVNEYQYCPRLAYLEWVQGEWEESSDTVEGRHAHRRVDKSSGKLPDPADAEERERFHARPITLSSNRLGLIAKMDLVEFVDTELKTTNPNGDDPSSSRQSMLRPDCCAGRAEHGRNSG